MRPRLGHSQSAHCPRLSELFFAPLRLGEKSSSSLLRETRYPAFTIGIRCATGGSAGKSVYGVL
jgi:hypothetical protein